MENNNKLIAQFMGNDTDEYGNDVYVPKEMMFNSKSKCMQGVFDFNECEINNNSLYIKANKEEDIKIDVQGYTNELMYTSENLKDGDYVNQFVPIDFSKIPKPNNQIGFNPEPKCSYGELPFANVNVNYLLKNC